MYVIRYYCRCRVPPEYLEPAATYVTILGSSRMVGPRGADGWQSFECDTEADFQFFEENLGAIIE